jgi:hypothetical protein
MKKTLYVLGRYAGTSCSCMVLDLEPVDAPAARNAVAWQRSGELPADRYDWMICDRIGPSTFRDRANGETLEAHQAPYTAEAWAQFLATWEA